MYVTSVGLHTADVHPSVPKLAQLFHSLRMQFPSLAVRARIAHMRMYTRASHAVHLRLDRTLGWLSVDAQIGAVSIAYAHVARTVIELSRHPMHSSHPSAPKPSQSTASRRL